MKIHIVHGKLLELHVLHVQSVEIAAVKREACLIRKTGEAGKSSPTGHRNHCTPSSKDKK